MTKTEIIIIIIGLLFSTITLVIMSILMIQNDLLWQFILIILACIPVATLYAWIVDKCKDLLN